MNHSKKNVHSSGPLGMLVQTGQVRKIDAQEDTHVTLQHVGLDRLKSTSSSYFRTPAGIEFKENELVLVDPKECEPWEYANRSADEMGNMDELIRSIQENNQLQPGLIRSHPAPHGQYKYQIIFGRRRHAACLALGIAFLVIKKDNLSKQEAIACQDAENKFRKNVSNYSNALLYKKLIADGTFKTEKELAEKLQISPSSLNDLLAFRKLPADIISAIPNIHMLSVNLALKMVHLLNSCGQAHQILLRLAPEVGTHITSPAKLERTFQSCIKKSLGHHQATVDASAKIFQSHTGKKLFTLKNDQKGTPCIVFSKEVASRLELNKVCEYLRNFLEEMNKESGYPDLQTNH